MSTSESEQSEVYGEENNTEGVRRGSRRGLPISYTYKIIKCKHCTHISQSKEDSFEHARTHIPEEQRLYCNKCNFVTEYKHHLEYHQRNHTGIKPFKCQKCGYACVNKTLLTAHIKSHRNYGHHVNADTEQSINTPLQTA